MAVSLATEYIELKARCESQMRLDVCSGCRSCSLRCSAGVPASRSEWDAIREHIAAMDARQTASLHEVLAQNKQWDLGDGVQVQMCRYFDMESESCAIYTVRPLVCRLLGHVEWMPCPIEKVPQVLPTPTALELLKAYAQMERRTLDEWLAADHAETE